MEDCMIEQPISFDEEREAAEAAEAANRCNDCDCCPCQCEPIVFADPDEDDNMIDRDEWDERPGF